MYEAISTLQEATLREWPLLASNTDSSNLLAELQTFLFQLAINSAYSGGGGGQSMDKFVLRHLLQTLSVFFKRNKLMDLALTAKSTAAASSSANKFSLSSNIVKDLIELFKSPNIKLVCCSCSAKLFFV